MRYQAIEELISFNPRPRAGGDGDHCVTGIHVQGFNPRPRAGGDA